MRQENIINASVQLHLVNTTGDVTVLLVHICSAANLAKRNCGSLPAEMRENAGDCYFVGHAHNFVNINA